MITQYTQEEYTLHWLLGTGTTLEVTCLCQRGSRRTFARWYIWPTSYEFPPRPHLLNFVCPSNSLGRSKTDPDCWKVMWPSVYLAGGRDESVLHKRCPLSTQLSWSCGVVSHVTNVKTWRSHYSFPQNTTWRWNSHSLGQRPLPRSCWALTWSLTLTCSSGEAQGLQQHA